MQIVVLLLIGIAFSVFAAAVFAACTLLLGLVWKDFEVTGLEGGDWMGFYGRYLLVAGVYTFITVPLSVGLLGSGGLLGASIGLGAMWLAFDQVFHAGWVQTLVICVIGGWVAQPLFGLVVTKALGSVISRAQIFSQL